MSDTLQIRVLGDGSTLYFDALGAMQIHDLGRGVSLHVRRGVISDRFAERVIDDGERQIQNAKRFFLMVDGRDVKMHTTGFRDALTTWLRSRESAQVHMLTQSRMLEMAVNVANLEMGAQRAKIYHDLALWEEVGKREVRTFASRPLAPVPKPRST
jgi:hypothetical protein